MRADAGDDLSRTPNRFTLWAGWVLSGLFVLFMTFDIAIKLAQLDVVETTLAGLGFPAGLGLGIGVLEAILLVLYVVPTTSFFGAVLFTGLFGGTMATHLRAGSPLLSHLLFGFYLALFAWGGLWLRDPALRRLLPLRR